MRKPQGYATIIEPGMATQELDTMSCAHCNAITHIKAGERPEDMGGLCKCCMGLICSKCVEKPCTPLLKSIEAEEARAEVLRSYGF